MFSKLLWIGLVAFAFGAGYYVAMPSPEFGQILAAENEQLVEQNQALAARNKQLEQTLDLVKRQIQTDRIAYASLQRSVDDAEQQREEMLRKFESQRELLDRLKKQLGNL